MTAGELNDLIEYLQEAIDAGGVSFVISKKEAEAIVDLGSKAHRINKLIRRQKQLVDNYQLTEHN